MQDIFCRCYEHRQIHCPEHSQGTWRSKSPWRILAKNLDARSESIRTTSLSKVSLGFQRPPGIRVRSLCVENMSGAVLQMLGHKWVEYISITWTYSNKFTTRYIIEPFFFSSSLNWLSSRYSEFVPSIDGDRTCTLVVSISSWELISM